MLPKLFPPLCWALACLLSASCGESLQAAPPEDAVLDAETLAQRERLSGEVETYRKRMFEIRRAQREIDQRLGTLDPAEHQTDQAKLWRQEVQELRLEMVSLRAKMNAGLDAIAALSAETTPER